VTETDSPNWSKWSIRPVKIIIGAKSEFSFQSILCGDLVPYKLKFSAIPIFLKIDWRKYSGRVE
jgi:hypothetical protein